ncbi:glutathione S-transferase family protein [Consotaella aegiceratis]|uniref:glutathione S-transferase family protein n=1 Tax=Consotaella aegiceratis TaxID=3097961 RepID=UPI002F3EC932
MSQATIVTAFDWVPSFAQGHVRDLRVRWALEEAGFPYEEDLLAMGTQTSPGHIARQPFGQVPVIEIDGHTMFESGAIVLKIAEASDVLMPRDPCQRDRVVTWIFASLNTVEPPLGALADVDIFVEDVEVKARYRPKLLEAVTRRLDQLQAALGESDYLIGPFSAADIMMAPVLRMTDHTDILDGYPGLSGYLARCTARPAFERALAAQLRPFAIHASHYEHAF